MTRRRSRLRALAAAAALAAAVAGCSPLPSSGDVHQGTTVVAEPGPVYLGTPDSPQPDASPVDIVQGFIDAQAQGVSDDFTVAHEFLSPQANGWDPWASVTVFSGEPVLGPVEPDASAGDASPGDVQPSPAPPQPGQRTVVRGTFESLAGVDADGVLAQEPTGTRKQLSFTLEADADGQWRISQLDDGIQMSAANFGSVYRSVSTYFPTTDHAVLVPDVRWFPQRTAPTQAVKAILAGPVEWLRDSVDSVVPTGTTLSVDSVVVDSDGDASVDLTASARSASAVDRAILDQQLAATLEQFSGIRTVSMLAAGSPLSIPVTSALARDPSPGDSVYVLAGGKVSRVVDGRATAVDGIVGAGADPTALAVGPNLSPVVVRRGSDKLVRLSGGQEAVLLTRPGLVAPSVDRLGWSWTASPARDGALLSVDADGRLATVGASWLEGRTVRSLQVSRDGARVVVVSSVAAGPTRVDVAGVVRNAAGAPVRLSDAVTVGATLQDALQAVWVDESTLAVLGRAAAESSPTVNEVPLGGFSRSLASVPGVVSLASGRGEHAICVATSSGELWGRTPTGAGWVQVATGVSAPTFPG